MLDAVQAKYKGDARRTYLVGESLGAEGALYLLSRGRAVSRRFAVAASISGSVETYDWENWCWDDYGDWGDDFYVEVAGGIPAKLFLVVVYGRDDCYVPVEMAQELRAALQAARKSPGSLWSWLGLHAAGAVHYLELDAGHEVWTDAYNNGLIEWLF